MRDDAERFAMEQYYIEPTYPGRELMKQEPLDLVYRDGPKPVPDEDVVKRYEMGYGNPYTYDMDERVVTGEGRKLRDDAIARVRARDPAWQREAHNWLVHLPQGRHFTTDDMAEECGYPKADPRAFGPVMMRAAKSGLVRKAGGLHVQSKRPQCHCRPIAVWERL